MLKLVGVSIEEFKEEINPHYKKLFPVTERKPLFLIKRMNEKGCTIILKVVNQGKTIGFFIVNESKTGYVQLDYFAIFEEYQSKGYGTASLELIKKRYKKSKGIFIEIEKLGLGKNKEQNKLREKRAKFYKRIGFEKLDFDVYLYGVIYTPCLLKCDGFNNADDIQKELFEFYYMSHRKSIIDINCRIV